MLLHTLIQGSPIQGGTTMALKPLSVHFNPPMELPVKSGDATKMYLLQPVDADTGVWVTATIGIAARAQLGDEEPSAEDIATIVGTDEAQDSMHKRVLGDLYQELVDDGVQWEVVKFFSATAVIWIISDRATAEEFWNNGGRPKASKKPADRKRSGKKTSSA